MLKFSDYTQEIELPDGNHLLANLLWQSFLELTPEQKAQWNLLKQHHSLTNCDLVKVLEAAHIVIDEAFDELAFMRTTYRNSRHSKDVLGLTIAPTIDCNLACVYCYEDKKRGRMTPQVEEQLRKYVDSYLPGRKRFNVIWYGGEPLLCKESVLSLSQYFSKRSQELGVDYTAFMTTNAMLLTPSLATQLAAIEGWRKIQVTIDGAARFHNARRPARGGQVTFDQIYANLISAIDILPVLLRMNVDGNNIDGCLELLELLASDTTPDKLAVFFSPIHTYGKGCRDVADNEELSILDQRLFSDHNQTLVSRARALGFQTENALEKKPMRQCQAVSTHSVIVEPDGALQRCWTEVGEVDKRIGHITEPVVLDSSNSLRWLQFDPTTNDPCRNCEVLPSCFGGCPQRHLDGRPLEMICSTIRFNTKASLLNDYLALHRPELMPLIRQHPPSRPTQSSLIQISGINQDLKPSMA